MNDSSSGFKVIDQVLLFIKLNSEGTALVAQTPDSDEILLYADANGDLFTKNGTNVSIFVSRVAPVMVRSAEVLEQGRLLVANSVEGRLYELTKDPETALTLKTIEHPIDKADALQLEENSFVNALIEDKDPVVTGEDGLKALKFIDELLNR